MTVSPPVLTSATLTASRASPPRNSTTVLFHTGTTPLSTPWATQAAGTADYKAPEIEEGVCDFPVDVFAFAMTVHQIFAVGFARWDDGKPAGDSGRRISQGARPEKPPGMPDCIWDVVRRCWKQAPAERPTFWQLVNEWKGARGYVVPGADRAQLLQYEEKVFRQCGGPTSPVWNEILPLEPEAARAFSRQVEDLLRSEI
jgi:serine/threonine protein kinase